MNHSQAEDESEPGCFIAEVVGWVWTQPEAARADFFSHCGVVNQGKQVKFGVTFKGKNIFSDTFG